MYQYEGILTMDPSTVDDSPELCFHYSVSYSYDSDDTPIVYRPKLTSITDLNGNVVLGAFKNHPEWLSNVLDTVREEVRDILDYEISHKRFRQSQPTATESTL